MVNANLVPGHDNYSRWSIHFKSHWTPAYIWSRYKEYLFRRKHPEHPWLTQEAIHLLDAILLSTDSVLEFGSGRSTVWFAKRVAKVISIENHSGWYKVVQKMLERYNSKVQYVLVSDLQNEEAKYRELINNVPHESIDLCLVDGGPRGVCALESIQKIKKSGYLVVDNINWFLPSDTKSPSSVRRLEDSDEYFRRFYELIKGWRVIWTSNGVTDTAIYIKP